MANDKLYIEYRVYFTTNSNGEGIQEMAPLGKQALEEWFAEGAATHDFFPSPTHITVECVREHTSICGCIEPKQSVFNIDRCGVCGKKMVEAKVIQCGPGK